MTEKKQKRYPTDRLKLHALLEKKEKELVDLREEVEEIRKLVQQRMPRRSTQRRRSTTLRLSRWLRS